MSLISLAQSALDAMPAAVYVCARDGKVMRYNRRASEFWGRRPHLGDKDERFCGAFRVYHLDGRSIPQAETPMATMLRAGAPSHGAELVIERPDGTRIIALATIEALRDGNGEIEGAIGCLQDITARKESEDRLRDSEQRSRALLEALPAAIYTTDANGHITFFNEAAADLWGHRPELGKSEWCGSWRIFEPDGTPLPHDRCPMAVALKEDRLVRDTEAIAERPDGTRIPFAPYPTPLHDASGRLTGAINMLVDISDHKNAEAGQRRLINELNHRVKNSLASAQAIVRHTLSRADDPEAARDAIDQRLTALARAHDLLSREGWRSADIGDLVRSAFIFRYGNDSRFTIEGPPVRLTPKMALAFAIALHELCDNALKYGALRTYSGRIALAWCMAGVAEAPRLRFDWRESGGPAVVEPISRGFGCLLLEWGLPNELNGEATLRFPATGVTCRIEVPLATVS